MIGLPEAATLPAIAWKVLNINRLKLANSEKYDAQRRSLQRLF